MHTIYLLLGSNLGNRKGFLSFAREKLSEELGPVLKTSRIYRTAAWGKSDVPEYLNQVLQLSTALEPLNVLDVILDIERRAGRERREQWGARTLDIDLLFYDDQCIDLPGLKVPHPLLHERRFTLMPLNEIAPDMIHHVLNKRVCQLLQDLDDDLLVEFADE